MQVARRSGASKLLEIGRRALEGAQTRAVHCSAATQTVRHALQDYVDVELV